MTNNLDSVNLPKDHYYINSTKLAKINNTKTIMKEWRILKDNLPDSIHVQTYETRIDLLRAAIIGPTGTPYHDGIFFFDIFLPPTYPTDPPQVYYHSRGYRLNPNLYSDGYVCLSLINTWYGTESEKWSSGSTILQLLVSIQALVLNARPFFNEPGLGIWKKSKLSLCVNASNSYNEEIFILSCWTMLHVIRKPPEGFEGFISEHFRKRAASLLGAVLNYQEGIVRVGEYGMNVESSSSSSSSSRVCVSAKFKANLEMAYALLYKAFDPFVPNLHEIEAEAMIEVRRRKEERDELVKHEEEAKNHKKGLLSKITSFVMKMWHCGNERSED